MSVRLFFSIICVGILVFFLSSCIALVSEDSASRYTLNAKDAEIVSLKMNTRSDLSYYIDWGDGTSQLVRKNEVAFHDYNGKYSGEINFLALTGNDVRAIEITGGLEFDISEIYEFAIDLDTLILNSGVNVYGNVADKPVSLTYIDIQEGDITGTFSKSSLLNVTRLRLVERSKIKLDIQDFDKSIKYIGLTGKNEIYGSLDGLDYPLLNHLDIKGENTITGDIGSMVEVPHTFVITGRNTISYKSAAPLTFISRPKLFILSSTVSGLSQMEVDQLLVEMDRSAPIWSGNKRIILTGLNEQPSVLSWEAIESLKAKGVEVFTN